MNDYEQIRRSIEQCLTNLGHQSQQLELMEHIDFFRGHDLASSRLLAWLAPMQGVGPWQVTFAGMGNLFIPIPSNWTTSCWYW